MPNMPQMPIGRLVTGNSDIACSSSFDEGVKQKERLFAALLYTWHMEHVVMKLSLDASPCVSAT